MTEYLPESRLVIGDRLGKGAYASVFKALDLKTGSTVAIKVFQLSKLSPSDVNSISSEVDLLRKLNHPNIVTYLGCLRTSDSFSIILEYCENGSLHSLSRKFGKFPEDLASRYISEVIQGLVYLHDLGIIHRDIKGANILVTKRGHVKLADFGVSDRATSTALVPVAGTAYWMAPEVIQLQGASSASDIWSLGCTIIELLAGKPPYASLGQMPAMFAMVNDEHPPIPDSSSKAAKNFLLRCFQKDSNLRISARMLLSHPWVKKFQKAETEPPSTYDEAIKTLRRWNTTKRSVPEKSERAIDDYSDAIDASEQELLNKLKQKMRDRNLTTECSSNSSPSAHLPQECSEASKPANECENNDDDYSAFFHESEDLTYHFNSIKLSSRKPDAISDIESETDFQESDLEVERDDGVRFEELLDRLSSNPSGTILFQTMSSIWELLNVNTSLISRFIQGRGLFSCIRLLQKASDKELVTLILAVLNKIFDSNEEQLKCFSMFGGSPVLASIIQLQHSIQVKLSCGKIIYSMISSSAITAQAFLCCNGLRILKSLLEMQDSSLELALIGVAGIWKAFELQEQDSTLRVGLCLNLSMLHVVAPLCRLLETLCENQTEYHGDINHICSILLKLSECDDLIKDMKITRLEITHLMRVLPQADFVEQQTLLKFIRNLTTVDQLSHTLEMNGALTVIVKVLASASQSASFQNIGNQALPCITKLCRFDEVRQREIVVAGIVPLLQNIIPRYPPLKELAIPLLSDLVRSTDFCRSVLLKNSVLDTYFSLLNEPSWQVNALETIAAWLQYDPILVEQQMIRRDKIRLIVSALYHTNANSGHLFLDSLLCILTASLQVLRAMSRDKDFIKAINEMSGVSQPPELDLNLLKLIRLITISCPESRSLIMYSNVPKKIDDILLNPSPSKSPIMLELAKEIKPLLAMKN